MFSLILNASAATLVVDQTGSGDTDTIQAALELARDGDTIEIEPGTYYENRMSVKVDNLTLRGAGPDQTVISTVGLGPSWIITLSGNITVEGIGFEGDPTEAKAEGVEYTADDETAVGVMQDCAFENFDVTMYSVGTFDTLYILDSTWLNSTVGVMTSGEGYSRVSSALSVENNLLVDMTVGFMLEYHYANPLEVQHNFTNNTFFRVGYAVSRNSSDGRDPLASLDFRGNLLAEGITGVDVPDDERGDLVANNIYYHLTGGLMSDMVVSTYYDNVEVDPDFCVWSETMPFQHLDLRLQSGSPAIDFLPEDIPSATGADIDGLVRPIDGDGDGNAASDAGAYEHDPAAPCGVPVEPEDSGDSGHDSPPDSPGDSPLPESSAPESPSDSPSPDSEAGDDSGGGSDPGCGCGDAKGAWLLLPGLALLLASRRRRVSR